MNKPLLVASALLFLSTSLIGQNVESGLYMPLNIRKAYSEGTIGWASDSPTLTITDGTEIPLRQTFVFRQEGGEWKLIQSHASAAMSD